MDETEYTPERWAAEGAIPSVIPSDSEVLAFNWDWEEEE